MKMELPKGCNNNGACSSNGCGKKSQVNWLTNMESEEKIYNIYEIQFKNGRKGFYRNAKKLLIEKGDMLIVQDRGGYDLGVVSMKGELVELQMKKKKVTLSEEIPIIYEHASQKKIDIYELAKDREKEIFSYSKKMIRELRISMKLSSVEVRADNRKISIYYITEKKVDYRKFIKKLAEETKLKIDMKYISNRHETEMLGGIGSCGRELCCSTWLPDFKPVNVKKLRYQGISFNQAKINGLCGKLKCCLNYELDTYLEAWTDIPEIKAPIKTKKGLIHLHKVDIIKKIIWFHLENKEAKVPIPINKVKEYVEINKKGRLVEGIEQFMDLV